MNLTNNDEYILVNPQILFTSDNLHLSTSLPEIIPAIESNFSAEATSYQNVIAQKVKFGKVKYACSTHTLFQEFSS